MSRAGRWLRKLVERILGIFHEGPRAPRRLAEEVAIFRRYRPDASAEEWAAFAITLANGSYEQGFARGYEWLERDWPGPADDAAMIAEAARHDWSVVDINPNLLDAPGEGGMTLGEQAELERILARGGVRVIQERRYR